MKYLIKVMSVMLVVASIYGFKNPDRKNKSKNAIDWNGVYKGKQIRDGKETVFVLYLNTDQTFTLQFIGEGDTSSTSSNGSLSWNKTGDQVRLINAENKDKSLYKLQENALEKVIETKKSEVKTESLSFQKIDLQEIKDKYWRLIEINKKSLSEDSQSGTYIFLNQSDNGIRGSSGCNAFNGYYELEEAKIKISKVAATLKACLDMETENQLFRTFQMVDNYTISADGQHLSFQKGKTVLARFEVDYLKIIK